MKNLNFKFYFLAILLAGIFQTVLVHADELPMVNLFVRYQDQIIYNNNVNLTSTVYHDAINDIDYNLNTSTVFSVLSLADAQSDAFNISDAQYNSTYNSFYLACLNISSSTENACYNWNYTVNGNYPSIGMDAYNLIGGETIYVYFSTPWKITAASSTLPAGATTTFSTWRYQYDNLINPWILDGNNLVDISIPNPNPTGWWDQTITVTTTQTDNNGSTDYAFSASGTYYAKIVSTDWSKWSNPITINVLEAPTTTDANTNTDTDNENPPADGTSGGNSLPNNLSNTNIITPNDINNAAQKIINFLKSQQAADGSIKNDLGLSDWTTMALGANNIYAADIKNNGASLYDYLYNTETNQTTDPLNICAGYARHILGLLAGGVEKNNTKIINLKNKINSECYQNEKIGQNGINDDVFILLSELATDEPISNQIVQTAINTIKADQQASGAFTWNGWSSPDITGAAINALKYAQTRGATVDNSIFQKAVAQLKSIQLADGGWGTTTSSDALTTSWAMYGINALGQNQSDWTNNQNKNPWSVLINQLNNDDYYSSPYSADGIDWFAEKHAVPALLGKSWPIASNNMTHDTDNMTQQYGQTAASISTAEAVASTTVLSPTTTILSSTNTFTPFISIVATNDATTSLPKKNPTVKIITKKPSTQKIVQPAAAELVLKSDATAPKQNDVVENIIEQSPVDRPSKNIAKKILQISGGGALGIGLLIGLGFLKNML